MGSLKRLGNGRYIQPQAWRHRISIGNIQLSAGEDTTPTIGSGEECSRNHYTYLLRTQTGYLNLQEYNNESGL